MKQTLRRYNAALSMIAVAVLIFSAVVFSTKGITQGGLCQVVMDGMQCEPQPEEAIKTQTDAPNQEVVALTAAPAFSATSMPTSVLTDANGNTVEVDVDAADWTAIDAHYFAENGYTLTDGNYYLSESITTTSTILIDAGTVDLCLNGYTIDANSAGHTVITVGEGAHLSLYDTLDSTQTTTADGDITDAETDDAETDDAETDDAETDEAAADDAETDDAATDDAETDDAETDEVATDDTATEPSTTTGGLITGGYSTGYGAGVYVSANATFYLYGGTIAGNTSEKAAGGVYVADADFTMYGGSISSNTANGGDGGGVYLNGGTFTMQGGSITGNTADGRGGGIVAYNDGALTIESGANITDNAAYNGGGIYNAGTLTLTGGSVTGNTATNNGDGVAVVGVFSLSGAPIVQDVYLYQSYSVATQSSTSYCITLTGAYTGSAISVATAMTPTAEEPIAVVTPDAAGYAISTDDAKGFLCAGTVGELVLLGDTVQLVVWSYAVSEDGTTIYRNSDFDDVSKTGDGGSLALVAPTGDALIYTGCSIVPTLNTATYWGETAPTITYYEWGVASSTPADSDATGEWLIMAGGEPTKVGTYQAEITLGADANGNGGTTAYVVYAIAAKQLSVTWAADPTYHGAVQTMRATLSDYVEGETAPVVTSYAGAIQATNVSAEGYDVAIGAISDGNYTIAASDASHTWYITALPYGVEDIFITDIADIYDYTSKAIVPKPTVTYGATTLVEGTDYTLSCHDNIAISTQESTASVTISFLGNFSGSATIPFAISYKAVAAATIFADYNAASTTWGQATTFATNTGNVVSSSIDGVYSGSITLDTQSTIDAATGSIVPSTATVYGTDREGAMFPVTVSYLCDSTAPTANLTAGIYNSISNTFTPTDGLSGIASVVVTGATDVAGQVPLSPDAYGSYTLPLGEGMSVTVTDAAGNTTTVTGVTVKADITIALNAGGGTDGNVTSLTVPYGTVPTAPAAADQPTKTGYRMLTWAVAENSSEVFDFSADITADTTIYATWALEATVGIVVTDDSTTNDTEGDVSYGNIVTLTALPSSDASGVGYTYQWYKVDDAEGDEDGSEIELTTEKAQTITLSTVADSGSYYVKVLAVDGSYATTAQSEATEVRIGTATLTVAVVDGLSISKIYNDTAAVEAADVADGLVVNGLFYGETATASGSWAYASADVGTHTVTVTGIEIAYGSADPANYTYAQATRTEAGSIVAQSVNASPTASAITYGETLANSTLSGNATAASDSNVIIEGTYAWADSAIAPTAADSGTTQYTWTFTPSSSNYAVQTGTVCLTVHTKAITIAANAQSVTYGTGIATGAGYVTDADSALVWGDEMSAVTLTQNATNVTGDANYTITPSAVSITNNGADVTANYNIRYADGTLTITNAEITGSSAADYSGTYDGAAHSITITAGTTVNSQAAIVSYGMSETGEYSTTSPTFIDVGEYTVYYKISAPNHTDVTGSATVTIAPKELENSMLTATGSYFYTGVAQSATYTVIDENAAAEAIDASDYTVSYSDNVNAGTATITITASETGNYTGTATGRFTIAKAPITFTIASDGSVSATQTATGSAQIFTDYTVSYLASNGAKYTKLPTASGSYSVNVSITDDNYCIADASTSAGSIGTYTVAAKAQTTAGDDSAVDSDETAGDAIGQGGVFERLINWAKSIFQ